ncbi:glycoside hydrolase family 95 protein [Draconibacterium sediminis]|uniref:Alpha-L-fucosidase n=1 Tax=Draconibacterium sediminis TaxID=1544798 RepID=A0A0D8J9I3_9BACT|nr:glycoside hydrolase family 95 protein [Draconibacterium sediminis]KJF43562.1 alpha-L-fucosidase [Draconibacterium sediminis]
MNWKKQYFLVLFSVLISCKLSDKKQDLLLWYNQPAKVWEEALPLGNGTTGAMVWGGISKEHYSLNDHSLWSGAPVPGNVKNGPEILEKVRKAIDDSEYGKAASLWRGMHGPYSARYLPLGDLFLNFDFNEDTIVTNYSRKLDLNTAVSTVCFEQGNVEYKREAFISYPDQAMIIRLTASEKEKISFSALISSKLNYKVQVLALDHLRLIGKAPKYVAHRDSEPRQVVYDNFDGEGMNFEIDLKLITKGGNLKSKKNEIGVQGANEVVIIMTEATSFNGFDKSPGFNGKDPSDEAMGNMYQTTKKTYTDLLQKHKEDYANLFERVDLNLGNQLLDLPTDERMIKYNEGRPDNGLVALYFQYGRYLMISSSRKGAIPSNLQGIWNQHVQPPWGSNYTVNINTEMNYWPAENTNLSECHQPLFHFMSNLAENGAVTAKTNYGIDEGWCVHHNSDVWAKTSPTGGGAWDTKGAPRWSCWPMGGAWFCQHVWEHYLYTGDQEFLKTEAWPLMKGAALFVLNWMVMDENGYWVTNPSSSPENKFKLNGKSYEISKASTMDMSIIRELLAHCLEAAKVIGVEDEFTERLAVVFPKLYPFHIGKHGQIQEWFQDWDDPNDNHRHISHLFSLYPGNQIALNNTPELASAAKQSLIHRGDVSTGWSMAWKINWWARLKDGDHALKILKDGLTYIGEKKEVMGGGGTYANLFDAHPPFQIDGNFGGAAGIAEMLVQSHEGYIELLPALPSEWPSGEVKGLVARGGFVVDLKWEEGRLQSAVIHSKLEGDCRVKVMDEIAGERFRLEKSLSSGSSNPLLQPATTIPFVNSSKTDPVELNNPEGIIYEWKTTAGQQYKIQPKK